MDAKDMAKKYYPDLWGKDRLRSLVRAGKLTPEDYEEITGEPYGEGSA